jgi:hypothetical protein
MSLERVNMENKKCSSCKEIFSLLLSFNKDKSSKDGYENKCKSCGKIKNKKWQQENKGLACAKDRLKEIRKMSGNRVPNWLTESDFLAMKCIYQVAAMRNTSSNIKWSVDHIIPLNGKTVCGLHVPSNLQVIPLSENLSKGRKYDCV